MKFGVHLGRKGAREGCAGLVIAANASVMSTVTL
jgi:hypothetical protein